MKMKRRLTLSLLGIVSAACCSLAVAGETGKNRAIADTLAGVMPSQLETFERVTKNIYQAPARKYLKEFMIIISLDCIVELSSELCLTRALCRIKHNGRQRISSLM